VKASQTATSLLLTSFIALCCALPLTWMLTQVLASSTVWDEFRWDAFRAGLLARTLLYNVSAAALAVSMALPASVVVGRGRGMASRAILFLLPLAVIMPSITYTYGWMQVFRLAGMHFEPAGTADVMRCIWTLACWLWPLPAIVIGLSLRFMDSQVQQQALIDGTLWRTTARQLTGPILASFAIVMVLSMQEFAVYERSGISVISTEVRTVFETGSLGASSQTIANVVAGTGLDPADQAERAAAAVATALPFLVIVIAVTLFALWAMRRFSIAEAVEPNAWPNILNTGPVATAATILLIVLTLVVPTAAMVISMSRPFNLPRALTVVGDQLGGSLFIGFITGLVALAIAALACVRRSPALLVISLLSFLIGGELLAIADIRLYNRSTPWPLSGIRVSGHDLFGWVYNNFPVMVIAFVGRFGWLALFAGFVSWSRPFHDLRAMAATDGADPLTATAHVVWPIVWPILVASAVLVVILSMTEVSATVLLSPQRPQMLVPLLMTWVHLLRSDDMLEGSLLLMAVVLVLGIGFVMLIWLATKIAGTLRRTASARNVVALVVLALPITGCDDGAAPEAIWCETGVDKEQLVYPRAITYSPPDDSFFVIDRMARVQHLDRNGRWLNEWRMPTWQKGKPVGVSVGPDGNVYIADTHYYRVMVYTPKGEFVREWGSEGTGPGQFTYPTDVAFDAAGNVYVSEYGDNDRIQVFDSTGKYIREFGTFGDGDGQFMRPQSMVIDNGLVYVTDSSNHRIVVFWTDGSFVKNLCSLGSSLGQLKFPYGLDADNDGHLLVCEFGNNRIQMIDKETGKGIKTWGVAGREAGQLAYPWAVAVDGERAVIVDSGNNRLQVVDLDWTGKTPAQDMGQAEQKTVAVNR
jgi:ABC-type Fe3+ transport system permease subunit/DNA-binding beta-propeller fold protein YncE